MACGTPIGRTFPNGLCIPADKRTNYKYPQDVPSKNVVAIFLAKFAPVIV
jgi:hypothetical protein